MNQQYVEHCNKPVSFAASRLMKMIIKEHGPFSPEAITFDIFLRQLYIPETAPMYVDGKPHKIDIKV